MEGEKAADAAQRLHALHTNPYLRSKRASAMSKDKRILVYPMASISAAIAADLPAFFGPLIT